MYIMIQSGKDSEIKKSDDYGAKQVSMKRDTQNRIIWKDNKDARDSQDWDTSKI